MANPFSKAKKIAQRAATAVKSTPKAAKQFGKTLVSEGRKELRDPNSSASRFARAPLGQSYLPEKVQRVGRALLPTPGGVVKSYQKGAREGGLKGFGRIALTNIDVGLLGTAGTTARGVASVGRAGGRLASRGLAARGLSAASEFGGVRAGTGAAKGAAKINKIQKALAATAPKQPAAASVAERAVAVAKADFAEDLSKTARMRALSNEAVQSGLSQLGTRSKALVREAQRRGMKIPTAGKPLPSTIGMAPPPGPTPNIMEYAAQKLGTAAKPSLGVSKGPSPAIKASRAAERAVRKPGPVKTRAMTAVEKAGFDNPKTPAGFDVPKEALGISKTAPKAPKKAPVTSQVSKAPVQAKPAPATGVESPPSKAAEVAARGVSESTMRSAVKTILGQKNVKRGTFSKLAKQHGISRQRVNQVVAQERKRLSLSQATNAAPEIGSAKTATTAAPKVSVEPAAKAAGKVPKAAKNTTPAAPSTQPTVSSTMKDVASELKATVKGKRGKAQVGAAKAAAEPVKVKVARKAAGETGVQAVKGPPKFLGRTLKFPKKTAALAGTAVLLANRDKFGAGGKGSTAAPASDERAFIKNLPDGLRQDIEALVAVKDKRGEAGLEALRQGLHSAVISREYNEFPTGGIGYSGGQPSPDKAIAQSLFRIKQHRDKVIQKHVRAAYTKKK